MCVFADTEVKFFTVGFCAGSSTRKYSFVSEIFHYPHQGKHRLKSNIYKSWKCVDFPSFIFNTLFYF